MRQLKSKQWPQPTAIGRWSATLLVAAGIQTLPLSSLQAAAPPKEITDSGITSVVENGLAHEKGVFPNDVDVSTSQDIVTLSGSVDNLLAKERAVKIAEGILGGDVGNLKAKTSAEQDAINIVGVIGVNNYLKVRPNGRPTDPAIETELKAALFWDPLVDSSTITVAVINRTAYLSGGVDSSFQKNEAQDVASRIKGVLLIHNHLKIEPEYAVSDYGWPEYSYYDWPYYSYSPYYYGGYGMADDTYEMFGPQPQLSDSQIKRKIEDRFFWSPFVDRSDIKVTVNGAVATLTGTVGTWVGWNEADKDARKSGATAVLNQITVKKHWL